MAGGLVALLDDVAALAKLAAASVDDVAAAAGRASVKAAGVVVDDTAVTPRYVQGLAADRELPIIKQIALGSLRNKLLIILPAALLLSQFMPGCSTPILMLGGTYLCYEGAEKVWEKVAGHEEPRDACRRGEDDAREDDGHRRHPHRLHPLGRDHGHLAQGGHGRAVRVAGVILVLVAIGITVLVYGVVGAHREDGRHRPDLAGARVGAARSASAAAWSRGCRSCCRRCRRSASSRCSGSVATSCSSGSTSSAGTRLYDLVHHVEEAVRVVAASVGSSAGSSTPSPRRSSASSSARSWSPS